MASSHGSFQSGYLCTGILSRFLVSYSNTESAVLEACLNIFQEQIANNMESNAKLTAKEQKIVEKEIEKLFSLLEIEGTFELTSTDDNLELLMDTKDSGMVIGYHGEILESLQLISSLIIAKKLDRFIRVSIEVDGYKKTRTEYLQKLAQEARERAISENAEQVITSLKSWERRIVHLILQDDEDVTSESQGLGRERVLVIKPKQ